MFWYLSSTIKINSTHSNLSRSYAIIKNQKHFLLKTTQPIQDIFNQNYGVLTFPLHEGIRRHAVSKPCQTQNNNKQIPVSSFLNSQPSRS